MDYKQFILLVFPKIVNFLDRAQKNKRPVGASSCLLIVFLFPLYWMILFAYCLLLTSYF